jgi:hypothetical protein
VPFLRRFEHRASSFGVVGVLLGALGCTPSSAGQSCEPYDLDGAVGGNYTFVLTVDDSKFSSLILKTQNSSSVSLSLENRGARPHDFRIDCLPTPNDDGCPLEACFDQDAVIAELLPGQSGSAEFMTPQVEGIYTFRSTLDGDDLTGQFVVQ